MNSSVAQHLRRGVAAVPADTTVGATFALLRGRDFDCLDAVYVVDGHGVLVGYVPMTRLMAAADGRRLDEIVDCRGLAVGAELDQEHLLSWASQHGIPAPAVVDGSGQLIGCVPPLALIDIGRREHAEDISRLAGILHSRNHGRYALESPPWRRALQRLPWLLVGLVGSIAATMIMAGFQDRLSLHVAIAFFIPAIVYLADAVGTQTEAVVVRGLSFLHAPRFSHLLAGEVSAGIIIGGVLGAFALPLVYAGFGDFKLALSVALAIAVAGSLATACGLILPWLLLRQGYDPAFGSGPVATVIQDTLSILIYFGIVSLVMPG